MTQADTAERLGRAGEDIIGAGADPVFWQTWGWPLALLAVVVVIGLLVHRVVFGVLGRVAERSDSDIDNVAVRRLRRPTMLVPALLGVQLVVPTLADRAPEAVGLLRHLNAIVLIVLISWLALAGLGIFTRVVLERHDVSVSDNLAARRVHTQLRVLQRVLATIVVIVGGAAVLMTFPTVRQFGASILASAGLAGLVLGLAARPVLENLFAGVQVALTQPIRLDDVVVIDGEWGRIEEITTTYVVVRVWDQRRLILPFSKILAESFQNWTRTNAEILGTVFLHVDYTAPVGELREEVRRICEGSELWDGRVAGLVVTDATERTLQVRALVSAADSGRAWDLRCLVRERLIEFLQREHPGALPREREEKLDPGAPGKPAGGGAGGDSEIREGGARP